MDCDRSICAAQREPVGRYFGELGQADPIIDRSGRIVSIAGRFPEL